MKSVLFAAIAALVLSGCATCREHPAFCATAGAVFVAGAIAASNAGGDSHHQGAAVLPFHGGCAGGPC